MAQRVSRNPFKQRGNINLMDRPEHVNADGSTSTVRSMGVNMDGKETLLPTIADDGHDMGPDEAVEQYRKTGKHLGQFDTQKESDEYAQSLHEQQELMLQERQKNRLEGVLRGLSDKAPNMSRKKP